MLDDPKNIASTIGLGFFLEDGVMYRAGNAHKTASQMPSSIAAAARQTMAAALAPPRSTCSANRAPTPRYSAMVDGTKISDSARCDATMPLTASPGNPASSRAAADSSAHCSIANGASEALLSRSGGSST